MPKNMTTWENEPKGDQKELFNHGGELKNTKTVWFTPDNCRSSKTANNKAEKIMTIDKLLDCFIDFSKKYKTVNAVKVSGPKVAVREETDGKERKKESQTEAIKGRR